MTQNTFLEIVRIFNPLWKREIHNFTKQYHSGIRCNCTGGYQLEIHFIQQQSHLMLENQQRYKLLMIFALKFRE